MLLIVNFRRHLTQCICGLLQFQEIVINSSKFQSSFVGNSFLSCGNTVLAAVDNLAEPHGKSVLYKLAIITSSLLS